MTLDAAPPGRVDPAVRPPSFVVLAAAVALLSAGVGCFAPSGASPHAIPLVRVQASSDLDCPQRDVKIVQAWGGQFEAIGCGHKATYNTACEGVRCTVAPEGQTVPWRARPDPTPTP